MTLKLHTEYGFRIIIYLLLYPDRVVPTREIAEKYGISVNHLNKVSQELVKLGCLTSERGKYGGIKINNDELSIKLGDFIEYLEPSMELAPCNGGGGVAACVVSPACKLKGILAGAQRVFKDHLNQFTLADLKDQNPQKIRNLFEQ